MSDHGHHTERSWLGRPNAQTRWMRLSGKYARQARAEGWEVVDA